MEWGVLTRFFPRPSLAETLDAIARYGLKAVQLNLTSAGLEAIPEHVEAAQVGEIARQLCSHGITVAAVSGTFNLIDLNRERLAENLRRVPLLARITRAIGAAQITLCTGTRDPENMWRAHPDNTSKEAWEDMMHSMERLLRETDEETCFLVEPEPANVIRSAQAARRLLDELQTRRLRIVFDGANLAESRADTAHRDVFREAVELLGNDIGLAHAKELAIEGEAESHTPGKGRLDWEAYFQALGEARYKGPVVLHGFEEAETRDALSFVKTVAAENDAVSLKSD